jgi:hypothetical protein
MSDDEIDETQREIFHGRPFASFRIFDTLLYGEVFDLFRDAPGRQRFDMK